MSERCPQESHVSRAAVEDRWTDSLRAHAEICGDCAAAAAVAPFMTRFGKMAERRQKLPDPIVIWLKAQILRASAVPDRVARPLNIIQVIAYAVVAGGWAAVLMWKWSDLRHWMITVSPAHMAQGVAGGSSSVSTTFFLMMFVLASVTVMLGLHTILAED